MSGAEALWLLYGFALGIGVVIVAAYAVEFYRSNRSRVCIDCGQGFKSKDSPHPRICRDCWQGMVMVEIGGGT